MNKEIKIISLENPKIINVRRTIPDNKTQRGHTYKYQLCERREVTIVERDEVGREACRYTTQKYFPIPVIQEGDIDIEWDKESA